MITKAQDAHALADLCERFGVKIPSDVMKTLKAAEKRIEVLTAERDRIVAEQPPPRTLDDPADLPAQLGALVAYSTHDARLAYVSDLLSNVKTFDVVSAWSGVDLEAMIDEFRPAFDSAASKFVAELAATGPASTTTAIAASELSVLATVRRLLTVDDWDKARGFEVTRICAPADKQAYERLSIHKRETGATYWAGIVGTPNVRLAWNTPQQQRDLYDTILQSNNHETDEWAGDQLERAARRDENRKRLRAENYGE